MSVDDILNYKKPAEAKPQFTPPDHWLPVEASDACVRLLHIWNSYNAIASGLAVSRFDPALNRLVFILTLGAIGRALDNQKPKWYKYGNSNSPLVVGADRQHCVVVEDAFSACAIWPLSTGIALHGTHLTDEAQGLLIGYESVTVALDKDASRKAWDIAAALDGFCKTRVVLLERDLKYCHKNEIKEILK